MSQIKQSEDRESVMKMTGYSNQEGIVDGECGYMVDDVFRFDVSVECLAVRVAVSSFPADPKPVHSR